MMTFLLTAVGIVLLAALVAVWFRRRWTASARIPCQAADIPGQTESIDTVSADVFDSVNLSESFRWPAGIVLEGFEVEALIHRGLASQVYAAKEVTTGREVVVKAILRPAIAGRGAAKEPTNAANTEFSLLSAAPAGRVAKPLALLQIPASQLPPSISASAIVLERLAGPNLEQHISGLLRHSGLEFGTSIRILLDLATALASLHEAGIVHGDLSARNIVFDRDLVNGLRIIDFGNARRMPSPGSSYAPSSRALGHEVSLSAEAGNAESDQIDGQVAGKPLNGLGRRVRGTPAYIAPEVVVGGLPTYASDIYSLGCIACLVLTGQPPFAGATSLEILWKQVNQAFVLPASARFPAPLERLIIQLLDKLPAERPESADVIVLRLREIVDSIS